VRPLEVHGLEAAPGGQRVSIRFDFGSFELSLEDPPGPPTPVPRREPNARRSPPDGSRSLTLGSRSSTTRRLPPVTGCGPCSSSRAVPWASRRRASRWTRRRARPSAHCALSRPSSAWSSGAGAVYAPRTTGRVPRANSGFAVAGSLPLEAGSAHPSPAKGGSHAVAEAVVGRGRGSRRDPSICSSGPDLGATPLGGWGTPAGRSSAIGVTLEASQSHRRTRHLRRVLGARAARIGPLSLCGPPLPCGCAIHFNN
jgi:hypothetical protein